MNVHAIVAIFRFEAARALRTALQSVVSPVLSTALYFVVFGGALGAHMAEIDGVAYGAFITPGLILSSVLALSVANASFGIYFPRFSGTIYEILSAPVSSFEIVCGYVGAAAAKAVVVGLIILVTARLFVAFEIAHPALMLFFLALTAVAFSLFGFLIGLVANSFEQLQLAPMLLITPLTFLGGVFYSIDMLPPFWRAASLANPIVYLVSGFRWSFFGRSDVGVGVSLVMTAVFLVLCLGAIAWIFRAGYRLRA
ncbi:ABC transporter permease [Methylocella sp.]|uniref:ABC transporter permease n=1 Tax=Methylocella sp. TaxID=1978226 RepID=UPI0037840784